MDGKPQWDLTNNINILKLDVSVPCLEKGHCNSFIPTRFWLQEKITSLTSKQSQFEVFSMDEWGSFAFRQQQVWKTWLTTGTLWFRNGYDLWLTREADRTGSLSFCAHICCCSAMVSKMALRCFTDREYFFLAFCSDVSVHVVHGFCFCSRARGVWWVWGSSFRVTFKMAPLLGCFQFPVMKEKLSWSGHRLLHHWIRVTTHTRARAAHTSIFSWVGGWGQLRVEFIWPSWALSSHFGERSCNSHSIWFLFWFWKLRGQSWWKFIETLWSWHSREFLFLVCVHVCVCLCESHKCSHFCTCCLIVSLVRWSKYNQTNRFLCCDSGCL